jgi:hypothetical protein
MPECTDAIWIEGKNIDNKIHPALPSRCSKDKKKLRYGTKHNENVDGILM